MTVGVNVYVPSFFFGHVTEKTDFVLVSISLPKNARLSRGYVSKYRQNLGRSDEGFDHVIRSCGLLGHVIWVT